MDKRLLIGIVVAAAAIMALPALAAPDYAITLKRVEESHVQPHYHALQQRSILLHQSINTYCKTDAPADADVKRAFHSTMDAWQNIQHIRHGPIANDDRHARIQFWPDKRAKTGKHLRKFLATGSTNDLMPEAFGNKSVAIQGLQALERLVFADDNLARNPNDGQSLSTCDVATAITQNIVRISKDLASDAQTTGARIDAKTAIRTHVTDLITGLEVVSRLKLSQPIGKERARPKLVENWRSERSLKNISINLQTMRTYYVALAGPELADDPESKLIVKQFDTVIKQGINMGNTMGPVLDTDEGRTQLRGLVLTLQDLRELVIIRLTGHLDINMGFNSLDGD